MYPRTLLQRLLRTAAGSRRAAPARSLVNRLVGARTRVVRVRTGSAAGARLELDLRSEKAYWLGHYELELQELLRAEIRPGDVFFDGGANIGFFTVLAGRLGARVVAIEPEPRNARRIARNAALNGLDVELVTAALWDEVGSVGLAAGGTASEWRATAGTGTPSVTLDAIAADAGTPDVIKLDVEGAEGRALRGAAAVLAAAPRLLVCEVHSEAAELEVRELLAGWEIELVGGASQLAARPPA